MCSQCKWPHAWTKASPCNAKSVIYRRVCSQSFSTSLASAWRLPVLCQIFPLVPVKSCCFFSFADVYLNSYCCMQLNWDDSFIWSTLWTSATYLLSQGKHTFKLSSWLMGGISHDVYHMQKAKHMDMRALQQFNTKCKYVLHPFFRGHKKQGWISPNGSRKLNWDTATPLFEVPVILYMYPWPMWNRLHRLKTFSIIYIQALSFAKRQIHG